MNSLVGLLGNVKEPIISTLQELLACLVSPEPCYPDFFVSTCHDIDVGLEFGSQY